MPPSQREWEIMQHNISGIVMAMPWDLAAALILFYSDREKHIIVSIVIFKNLINLETKIFYLVKQLWLLKPKKNYKNSQYYTI